MRIKTPRSMIISSRPVVYYNCSYTNHTQETFLLDFPKILKLSFSEFLENLEMFPYTIDMHSDVCSRLCDPA